MTDSRKISMIGSIIGVNIVGVGVKSLDGIMNGTIDSIRIVVKSEGSNTTVDDLKGEHILDTTGTINVNSYSFALNTEQIEKLKKLLTGKKFKLDIKNIRFTYKNTEVAVTSDSSAELKEALEELSKLISKS